MTKSIRKKTTKVRCSNCGGQYSQNKFSESCPICSYNPDHDREFARCMGVPRGRAGRP